MERIQLNVSGTNFQICRKIIEEYPDTRLYDMCHKASQTGQSLEFVIDRPADCFAAILALYQTGELHIPANVCPGAFYRELSFWNIDSERLASCCQVRYHSFFDEQETLTNFNSNELKRDVFYNPHLASAGVVSMWAKRRAKLWAILDNREVSIAAKIYFFVALMMVTLSILSMALASEPSLQRKLTKCEIRDYVMNSNKFNYEEAAHLFEGLDCSEGFGGGFADEEDWDFYTYDPDYDSSNEHKGRSHVRDVGEDYYLYYFYETELYDESENSTENGTDSSERMSKSQPIVIKLPKATVRRRVFDILDWVVMAFFTVELVFRLICCPSLKLYMLSIINGIDFLTLVCAYTHTIIQQVQTEEKYQTTALDMLEYLQMLRAFRLLRVVKNVTASKVLIHSVKQSARDLLVLVMFLIIGVVTFSNFLYFAESRKNIQSIPVAWWWAMVTMTTVGYGDFVPKSTIGRIIGSFCAVSGVILLSITVPIFVNNFIVLYQYAVTQKNVQFKTNQAEVNRSNSSMAKVANSREEVSGSKIQLHEKLKTIPSQTSIEAWQ